MKAKTALPDILPIFPLSRALLLPRGHLPLNIFEPRYVKMVEDAMAGHKLIAMIQPRAENDGAALYDIGCVGKIAEFEATKDGRFLINLEGVSRFRLKSEVDCPTPYRQAVADYGRFAGDAAPALNAAIDRDRLIEALRAYLDSHDFEADWEVLEAVRDETLVNSVSMLCPFEAAEKQALLEAEDLTARAEVLTALLEFDYMAAADEDILPPKLH